MIISVMEAAGGLGIITKSIGTISNPITVNGFLALFSGIISAYSSSSGVVLPMFLPMVPGVIAKMGGGDPASLITSICVGSHLVDTSPLSLFGALCLATAASTVDKGKLFRNLLIWGLSMSVVAAWSVCSCSVFSDFRESVDPHDVPATTASHRSGRSVFHTLKPIA